MTRIPAHDADLHARLERLAQRDPFVRWLGVTIDRTAPGAVRLTMPVREDHMNFNGTCHCGVIFSLADTAFGLASNSHGTVAIGIHADVAFCSPVGIGEVIVAEATEASRTKRVGTYPVRITKEDGTTVALFTGTVHRTDKNQSK